MQTHGPAISNAYFAKPLEESLSLKEKNCGFSKRKFKLMQVERTEIRHRISKTSYLPSPCILSFLAPKKRRKGFEGMCVTPRESLAQGLRLLSVSPRILE